MHFEPQLSALAQHVSPQHVCFPSVEVQHAPPEAPSACAGFASEKAPIAITNAASNFIRDILLPPLRLTTCPLNWLLAIKLSRTDPVSK